MHQKKSFFLYDIAIYFHIWILIGFDQVMDWINIFIHDFYGFLIDINLNKKVYLRIKTSPNVANRIK